MQLSTNSVPLILPFPPDATLSLFHLTGNEFMQGPHLADESINYADRGEGCPPLPAHPFVMEIL